MTARSKGHHEIPKWLLKHFCCDKGETFWMGFKDTGEVKPVVRKDAFRRNDANTRIDYQIQEDGTFRPAKSDPDEKLLARFDSLAAPSVRQLLDFSRRWRDAVPITVQLSRSDLEICKQTILVQARRTLESQDRMGINQDKSELYLDLYFKLAEEHGQQLPPKQDLLNDPKVASLFADLSQNYRANFASVNHSILAKKETEFLAPLGLSVAVIGATASEFIIGSHGVTIVETTQGETAWLPIAPDVAISLSDKPGVVTIGAYTNEFVEQHNTAAFSASARVAGRSKGAISELIATMD